MTPWPSWPNTATPWCRSCAISPALSRQGIRSLEQAGLVSLRSQEEYRISRRDYDAAAEEITLNDEQQRAYDDDPAPSAAMAAPASPFCRASPAAARPWCISAWPRPCWPRDRSVMILVPEIALTPQMMARFSAYFGDQVALLHSGLRLTERYDQWKRIRRGEATRGAGYPVGGVRPAGKSGADHPGRGAGELLRIRKRPLLPRTGYCQIPLRPGRRPCCLLGSATPTVETAYHARQGDYQPGCCCGSATTQQPPAPGRFWRICAGSCGTATAGCISRQLLRRAGEESGGGGAEHSVSEPPGQQPAAAVPPVRLCAPVPPVQRVSDLSLRQRADDVPLLRLFRACASDSLSRSAAAL